jgi:hypothetical protein
LVKAEQLAVVATSIIHTHRLADQVPDGLRADASNVKTDLRELIE